MDETQPTPPKQPQPKRPTQPTQTLQPQQPEQQPPRRRRQHKRSRNGCYTCKQRHIRCDEQRPICTNCLVRGGACGYPDICGHASSSATDNDNHGADSSTTSPATADPTSALQQSMAGPTGNWSFEDLEGVANSNNGSDGDNHWLDLLFRMPYIPSPTLSAYHSVDPFDSLPEQTLTGTVTHYRILTRSLIPKNANNTCIAMCLEDPALFRSCILLSAMHYSWINGSLGDIEETYLYHKVEAIRLVNEHIADPASSEMCANIIAALALAESGVGDIAAAEAHLNGLLTLINWRKPDEWQGRLHGLFQRMMLVAGTFISATKGTTRDESSVHNGRNNETPPSSQRSHFTRPTTNHFSAAQFDATKLSPFYFTTPPDYEASNADLEGMAISSALQRLSALPNQPCKPFSPPAYTMNSSLASASEPTEDGSFTVGQELTQVLLLETESYLASLLFKPDVLPVASGRQMYQPPERLTSKNNSPQQHQQQQQQQQQQQGAREQQDHEIPAFSPRDIDPTILAFDPGLLSPDAMMDGTAVAAPISIPATSYASMSMASTLTAAATEEHSAAASPLAFRPSPHPPSTTPSTLPPYTAPYDTVSPAVLPSSSRAWAAAAYIYLYTVLGSLWHPPLPSPRHISQQYQQQQKQQEQGMPSRIDPDLRRWLLDTLCTSLERTREAMVLGAYSRELWVWQVLVGAYAVATTAKGGHTHEHKYFQRQKSQAETELAAAAASCIDPSLLDRPIHAGGVGGSAATPGVATATTNKPSELDLGAWFCEQMRVWAEATNTLEWTAVTTCASKVAWPQTGTWPDESLVEDLWCQAMAGLASP